MSIDAARHRNLWRTNISALDRGAVLFQKETAPWVYTDTQIPEAWFRQGSIVEAENSNGAYLVEELKWYIPREFLPDQPYPNNRITSISAQKSGYPLGNKTFVVGKDGSKAIGAEGVWEINAVRPFVNPARGEIVTVYRKQPVVGYGGIIEDGTPTILAGPILAAIQEADTFRVAAVESEEVFGRFQNPQPVRIFLNISIRVQPHDFVIRQSDNRRYTIFNDASINLVGQFMELHCQVNQ